MNKHTPLYVCLSIGALCVVASVWTISRHNAPRVEAAAPIEMAPPTQPAMPEYLKQYTTPAGTTPAQLQMRPETQVAEPIVPQTNLTHNPHQILTPQRVIALPLSVSILGQEEYTLGKPVMFTAVIAGPAVEVKWKIKNRETKMPVAGLTTLDGGRNASFTGDIGKYTVTSAVGGENGAVDFWDHDFEVVNKPGMSPNQPLALQQREEPMEEPEQPHVPQQPPQPQPVDLATYVGNLVNGTVQSPNRLAESVTIGAAFRETGNLIGTGQFAEGEPLTAVRRAAALSLGQSASYWEPFFNGVDALLANLRQNGQIKTLGDVGVVLKEVGNVLASAH